MHKNLQLALLDNLMQAQAIPRFDLRAFFQNYRNEPFDPDCDYDFLPLQDVESHLLGIPLRDADLLKLEELDLEATLPLHLDVFPQWSGEDGYFNFPSLDGLERCANVRSAVIGLLAGDAPAAIGALGHLHLLEAIRFDGSRLVDLSPLARLPRLGAAEFVVTHVEPTEANRLVIGRLRANGCKVSNKLPQGMHF